MPNSHIISSQGHVNSRIFARYVEQTLKSGKIKLAEKAIRECVDESYSEEIMNIVMCFNSHDCWLALLENPYLNDAINADELNFILHATRKAISRNKQNVTRSSYQIGLAIAQNPLFCRRLGYSTLTEFLGYNRFLDQYITSNENLLKHLDYKSIVDLSLRFPIYTQSLLESILNLLNTSTRKREQQWARLSIQWLFSYNPHTRSYILKEPDLYECLDVSTFIRIFKIDCQYAFEILNNPTLRMMFKIPSDIAIENSQLSGKDYLKLAVHYLLSLQNHLLAKHYFKLALSNGELSAGLFLTILDPRINSSRYLFWLQLVLKDNNREIYIILKRFYELLLKENNPLAEKANLVLQHFTQLYLGAGNLESICDRLNNLSFNDIPLTQQRELLFTQVKHHTQQQYSENHFTNNFFHSKTPRLSKYY